MGKKEKVAAAAVAAAPRRVTFNTEVIVNVLPLEERRDAWRARFGSWVCAPKHDELWDGTKRQFRERELTPKEFKQFKSDRKIKKVLPSSVFYLYKRYRKKIPDENKREGGNEEEEEEEKRNSDTVPKSFIDDMNSLSRTNSGYVNENPDLKSVLKNGKGCTSPPARKRWSLKNLISNASTLSLDGLLRRDSELDSDAGEEDGDMSQALPWLERIQQLDGLSNSKVPRSSSVENIWDQMSDGWKQLQLLGQSLIWDAESVLREVFPAFDPYRNDRAIAAQSEGIKA